MPLSADSIQFAATSPKPVAIGMGSSSINPSFRLREKGLYASFPHLTPEVDFDGRRWIVRIQELASVTAGDLGPTIGRIDREGGDILRAVDILTRGF